MSNEQLITKILSKIQYESHKLSEVVLIDDIIFTSIVYNTQESSNSKYRWVIACENYEIPLTDLTNRELLKVYKSL